MKKCINCGAELIDSAKFCSECGTKQEPPKKFCIECGEELIPEAKFCINCGKPVNAIASTLNTTPEKVESANETAEEQKLIQPIKEKNEFEKKIEEIKDAGGIILYPDEDMDKDYLDDIISTLVPEFKEEIQPMVDAYIEKAAEVLKLDETKWKKFGEPGKDIREYGYPDDDYEGKLEYVVIDQEILVIRGEGNTFRVLSTADQKDWEENFWILDTEIKKIKNKIKCVVIASEDTSVRARVFKDFKNLEIVFVNDEVTGFRREAFCKSPIRYINFPKKLEHIVTDAFKDAKFKFLFFEPIEKEWSDVDLQEGAFSDCKELKYVFVPKSIIEVDEEDEDDEGLDQECLKEWFEDVFRGCSNLNTNIIWDLDEIKPLLKPIDSSNYKEDDMKKTLILKEDDNGKWGYVDEKGNWVIRPKFDDAWDFKDGIARVELDGKWGFIKPDGSYLVEPMFDNAYNFEEGFALVRLDGKWGFIKPDGSYLVEPQFDDADDFEEGFAGVRLDDKWGFIKTDGTYLVEPKFDYAYNFSEGFARVELDDKWGFIKTDGTYLVEPQFDDAENFIEGFAGVKLDGKYGFIEPNGTYLIEPKFDDVGIFSEGFAKVKLDDKWGFIKTDGNYLLEPQFDDAWDFEEGFADVELDGEGKYVDVNGNIKS